MAGRDTLIIASPIPGIPYLGLHLCAGVLCAVDFLDGAVHAVEAAALPLSEAPLALQAYFDNARTLPSLPLAPVGTPFQQRVWQALQEIPAGETLTYGALARRLRSSARAVARACRANPLPILIPCHRVVAAHDLGGYMGQKSGKAMGIKRWLLRHEGYSCAQ